jgi:succinate dehydrogenase/fumarate reductase flavoprotein subunit
VIVGAGLAGLSSAVSAAEQKDTKVVVVEKTASWVGRGGGIGVIESRLTRKLGIKNDKEEIAREWMALCGNRANEKLVWLFLNKSGEAMDWFLDKADAMKLPCVIWGGYYNGATYREHPGYHMFMGGPQLPALQ